MAEMNRPISLKEFAQNLPPSIAQNMGPLDGRYVFGGRACDTVPYVVAPGAAAEVYPEDIPNMPISTKAYAFVFDLSNPEHLIHYQVILNAVHSGWYKQILKETHYDKEKRQMVIYIEVLERHRKIEAVKLYDQYMAKLNNKEPVKIT